MYRMLPVLFLFATLPAFAADDPRLSFLEQEVRNLNRQVQVLSRQMDALRAQPRRMAPEARVPEAAGPVDELPQWVNAAKWRQLRTGMSELEVIGALGPPTSMREDGGGRVLLYALEIGASGFLGGSVTLRDRVVAAVRPPSLQ
jgi:hypothetical protein